MPSIVIVPGSFSGPEHYQALVPLLNKDYEVIVGTLQSADREPPRKAATMHEDAAYFRGIIEALASQGKDVIIIGHSYGGSVANESVQGVTKPEREARGLKGGVVKIVYLATRIREIGDNGLAEQGDIVNSAMNIEGDFMYVKPEFGTAICSELPDDQAAEWGSKFRAQSVPSFADAITHYATDLIPGAWLLTKKDQLILPEAQKGDIERLQARKTNDLFVVALEAGHMVNLADPEGLASAILDIVGK